MPRSFRSHQIEVQLAAIALTVARPWLATRIFDADQIIRADIAGDVLAVETGGIELRQGGTPSDVPP